MASFFTILLLLLASASVSFSTVKTANKTITVSKEPLTAEQQYKAAKEIASHLEQGNSYSKERSHWLNNAHTFRKIHIQERKGILGPTSLYMSAKTYRRMFDLFKTPPDLETALNAYLELADLYPGHTLADDSLLEAAECAQLAQGKESLANDLYLKILNQYPQGDQVDKAKIKISGLKPNREKQAPPPPALRTDTPEKTSSNLAQLAPIKYWSSDNYCRIVLQTATPVTFSAQAQEKNGNQFSRLTIELAQSQIPPAVLSSLPIREGLLKTIRPEQSNTGTARILLELESLSDYSIFSLADPFRIVVDIRGEATTSQIETKTTVSTPVAIPSQPAVSLPADSTGYNTSPSSREKVAQDVVSLVEQKKRSPKSESSPATKNSSQEKLSLAQQLGLGVRKIIIDPGHGGKDPGAMAFGLKEKDVVLKIAKKVEKILKESYRFEVVLTRTTDVYLPLEERTAFANTHKCDLFLSIHINAHADQTRSGIETYFLNLATDPNAMRVAAFENATSTHSMGELQDILKTLMKNSKIDESTRLARFIQTNLVSGLSRLYRPRDLGVKQAPFYVLIGAEMPAILAEISFITNPEEAKLLQDEKYLDKIAAQLAAGIAAYVEHRHTAAMKIQN